MTILNCLARIIPVRWPGRKPRPLVAALNGRAVTHRAATKGSGAVLLAVLCGAALSAQPPMPQTRAGLIAYANAHPKDSSGALALLALGVAEVDQKQFSDAIPHLKAAGKRL